MNSISEASATVDEALTVYRTSTCGWETADEYIRNAGAHPTQHKIADPGVQLKSVRPLPSIFTDQYNNIQYRSYMGLFPEINRAWLTIDSKLFLWAYASSSSQGVANDFFVFEDLSQIIVSVALISPRQGVFVESVQYLVAVATTVEVTLLGATFSSSGEISLLPTHISISTDNVMMLKIVATPEGRIFMAGADGALHEFVYDSRPNSSLLDLISGRPTKRARKLTHGSSKIVNMFLPSAFKAFFARSDGIVDLAIDGNALYTLSQSGVIAVYDISIGANCVATVNAKQEAKSVIFSVPSNDREFVSIHAVPSVASNSIHLILVTSFGERIYFSVCDPSSRLDRSVSHSKIKPTTLRYISFRPSPDKNIKTTRPCVHMAWCENGTAVLADLREKDSDRLITIFPDAGLTAAGLSGPNVRPGTMKTSEVVFEVSLGSPEEFGTYNPTENVETPVTTGRGGYDGFGSRQKVPKRTFSIAGLAPGSSPGPSGNHEAPNMFWVLTSSAMHLYERIQPIDRLREILSAGGGSHTDIGAFFARHGAVEACSVCLEISITSPKLSSTAAKVYYNYGSELQHEKSQKGNDERFVQQGEGRERFQYTPNSFMRDSSASRGFDIGRPSIHSTPLPRFSGAHDGLTWYLAKILHPIWTQKITPDQDPNAYQHLSVSRELITGVREKLLLLLAFLEKYPPDTMLPDVEKDFGDEVRSEDPMHDSTPIGRNRTTSSFKNREGRGPEQNIVNRGLYQLKKTGEARRAEAQSIISLQNLISRSIEALALLMILSDHQIHRLSVSMPSESRELLATMRFCDLVVSGEGRALSSALIEAIFSSYRDGATAVSTVGRMLQDRCPSYFGDADVDLHRALALLKKAVHSVTNVQFETPKNEILGENYDSRLGMTAMASGAAITWTTALQMAEEAARMLKQVPDRIFDILSLCEDFKAMHGELPFIDVALTIGKSAEAKGNEDRAIQAYKCILDVLKSFVELQHDDKSSLKSAIMQTVLTSKSEVFLRSLYEFLLQTESGRELIIAHLSPNLERFLEEKKAWDVLWKYCARHERYLEAAGVLLNLCESDNDMGLVDRLNQLSCALHSAKTALSKGDNRANLLLAEITDFMDVAKLQLRVKEELKRHHPPSEEICQALRDLNGGILNLSTLFNRYARPYKLYESCLQAFICGSHRDDAFVRGLWREIIHREIDISNTPSSVSDRVQKLGREFYPCDFVFPISFIMEVMEFLAFENRDHGPWKSIEDWTVSVMKSIGIPLSDVIEGYRKMMESSQLSGFSHWSWSDSEAQFHLLKATERAIVAWSREQKSMKGSKQITTISECDKVQRTITLCKSKLRALSDPGAMAVMERFEKEHGRIENDFENRFQEDVWDTLISGALYPAWSDMKWNVPQYARELALDLSYLQAIAASSVNINAGPAVPYNTPTSLLKMNYVHHRLDRIRGLQYVVNYAARSGDQNRTFSLLLCKGFNSGCFTSISAPLTSDTVYILLPYKSRTERLRLFFRNFLLLRSKYKENIVLIVSVLRGATQDMHDVNLLKREIFGMYPEENKHVILSENDGDQFHQFSRGVALREASKLVPNDNAITLHCDVDMVILPSFFERCRHNSILGSQVYYPVFYSLYPYANANPVITERNGFWRKTSFGMTCIRKGDFQVVSAYADAETRFQGWGSEDVYQFELIRNTSNLVAFRAVEPGLLHRWHVKDCDETSEAYADCMKTNFVTMGHPLKIGPVLLKAIPDAKKFFSELERIGHLSG
ncbi:unnamed protein product [Agarophyton chilense]